MMKHHNRYGPFLIQKVWTCDEHNISDTAHSTLATGPNALLRGFLWTKAVLQVYCVSMAASMALAIA